MNMFVVLILMLFFHVVDDYYLQGVLAKMKQQKFWEGTGRKYKNDYMAALYAHAFSWTFMITLPLLLVFSWNPPAWFYGAFIFNWGIHAMVDDYKCNLLKINLVQDQLVHVGQILFTWILYVLEVCL